MELLEPLIFHFILYLETLALVVSTGLRSNMGVMTTEIFPMEQDPSINQICFGVDNFVAPIHEAGGGLLRRTAPVICGGSSLGNHDSHNKNTCYVVGSTEPVAILAQERFEASSVVINNGTTLWITGGSNGADVKLRSTELVTLNDDSTYTVSLGPELEHVHWNGIDRHCMAHVETESTGCDGAFAVLSGGSNHWNKVWSYGYSTGTWTQWPNTPRWRQKHACGMVLDTADTSIAFLVLTTGTDNVQEWNNEGLTDLMELGSSSTTINQWTVGPEFPVQIKRASSLVSPEKDYFLVTGGHYRFSGESDLVFKFQCSNRICEWTQLDFRLDAKRRSPVAMLVPFKVDECCVAL